MRRRDVITLLGGAAVAWPLAAIAQQSERMRRIGVLAPSAQDALYARNLEGLRRGLSEFGYVEGRNFVLETRWADGNMDRLPVLATELVEAQVDVIVASSALAVLAAARATESIPIVQASGADPIRSSGLAGSLSRPGRNVTGVTNQAEDLSAKMLELLLTLIPKASRIGVLFVPDAPVTMGQLSEIQQAARAIPVATELVGAGEPAALDPAFAKFAKAKVEGLVVLSSAFSSAHSRPIVGLAGRAGLPTIYPYRHFVLEGGLMSYGTNLVQQWRQSARFVDRILRGVLPAALPIEQPTKFDLVVNLIAAKALNLEIPPMLLARADEVIE
jgi:putative tryptophan/tyrosine transport system substrate-binding protein